MKLPRLPLPVLAALAGWACGGATKLTAQEPPPPRREPVHPRRNVEEFPPVEARFLRFTISAATNNQQPCLDELEVYGPDAPEKNLALASLGTHARASGTLPLYRIHALPHINDGLYGNGHSWISDTAGTGWVELEFAAPVRINRVVWSRDRERKFIDRLPTDYRVETALTPGDWRPAASSADRSPPPELPSGSPFLFGVPGYSPASASASSSSPESPGNDRPAAREYLLRTWQTADGLPSNTVTSLLQTRDGWLWAGTTNGLARFDGKRFTAYGESQGLRNLHITCLLEDRGGTLWAGTEGSGLAAWRDGYFQTLTIGGGLAGNTVLSLAEDAAGSLWIATAEGLHQYSGGQLRRRLAGPVTRLAAGPDGLWLLHRTVLSRWDGTAAVPAPEELDPSRFSSISAITGGPDGSVWFGGANGYVGRLTDGMVTTFGEGHSVLTSNTWELLAADGEDVWIGTSDSGLARLRGHELLHITTDDGLPSNCVRALRQDREGNVWVGTAGGGLTRLRPRRVAALTTRDGLSHNGIMALAQDAEGTVWIGTDGGGLNRWNGGKAEPRAPSYVLENQTISSLAPRRDGSFWLGTSGGGAFRLRDDKVEHFSAAQGMPGGIVTALCEDSRDRLWAGTQDGGPALEADGAFTRPAALASLAGLPVTCILEAPAERLWFGTNGKGVARLEADGRLTRWTRSEGLASDFIRTLRADCTGVVWAGSNSGLTRWKGASRPFSFTKSHGLPNAVVSQILDDGSGHLWIGTNGGVLRIPLTSFDDVETGKTGRLEILALGTEDGLPSLECTGGYHPAGLRMTDGRLCFGTVAGLAIIRPSDFTAPREAPPVVIETVTLGSSPPRTPGAGLLLLPPDTSRLAFDFTALAFGAPDGVRFRYRMAGLEEAWVGAGTERTATYTRLAPGDYRFEVIASSGDGPWSAAPASLALRAPAPWWRSPWALAAGVLLSAAAVAGIARAVTRRRLQRSLREVERQFALERERSRIARDIHDDLGANLTQISLLSALGHEQRHDPARAGKQFAAISATSGELVQAMDAIVWAVNPSHDTLESLARYLVRFAGDFFEHTDVRLRLDVPPQLPRADLSSEVRHNLFLAAKEALHNALHHAAATEVTLRLTTSADHAGVIRLVMEIGDDGRGFLPNPDGEGNGLGNMRHRLSECGGTCEIRTTRGGGGTLLRFSLPLPPSAS